MFKGMRNSLLVGIFLLAGLVCAPAAWAQGPTPGQNVNMVSGTQWPGGDPFLQRQNEPSIAVSSRNPQHLLAGANDYRTVDLNFFATGETGDAWLGVFKSFDGGTTWQSTLLPGYPLDGTPEGLASPLKTPTQFQAASDPVVRAGTNGLFFYSGIAFNRTQNSGVVFISRFIDLNNKENGKGTTTTITNNTDPIRYIGTAVLDSGNSGQFLDKPWIAVDIPRGTAICTINVPEPGAPGGMVTQKIPAGNVYMAWSDFVGNSLLRTKVYFSRSTDCGATWSSPVKLSETFPLNQGVTISVDPSTGNVYVAWRTVAAASTPDGISVAKSTNGGQTFATGVPIISLPAFAPSSPSSTPSFFDEITLPTTGGGPEMRTTAFPSMAIDGCGQIYVAWSQRDPLANGDSRIMMSTSVDGVNWSTPIRVDNSAVTDDYLDSFTRGNQFMPSLTFAGGKLMVLYYDLRLDHTLGSFAPAYSFTPDGFPLPDPEGRLVLEQRVGLSEPSAPIFTPFVNDAGLTAMRHTLDVRVAQFTPSGACPTGAPGFSTARVSQFRFGTTGLPSPFDPMQVQQLEDNPPNLPIFEGGVAPFVGDYVDIAGSTFKLNGNSWVFNTAPVPAPVHIATWTDNRDVQPPLPNAQGIVDWTKYTPILSGQSVFDPTQTRPPCDPTATASRNQNIYSSRITQGLVVSSPQTSKPLSTTLQRSFVILVQNFTQVEKSFRLTIPNQPQLANGSPDPNGFASFVATSNPPASPLPAATTQLDVTVGPHNGITRPLFALSGNPTAGLTVNVQEITAPMGTVVSNGLSSSLLLNADGTVPGLIDPDGAPAGTSIVGVEVYNPNVSSPNVSSPNVSSPNVSSPNVSSPNVSSPNVSSPNVSSQSFANSPVSGLAAPNVSSPNVSSPNVSSPNVSSPNVSSPNVSSASLTTADPISDADYTVTNIGNTSASYHIVLVSAQPVTSPLQLLINKIYATPVAVGCSLGLQQANVLLADVYNPPIQTAVTFDPTNTQVTNPSVTNSTFSLAPGEQALLTLRGQVTTGVMNGILNQVTPIVVSQAANTDTNTFTFSTPLFIATGTLPNAVEGIPYNANIVTVGGTPPDTLWAIVDPPDSLVFTSIPPNTLAVSGTPASSGVFSFDVSVSDSSVPIQEASRTVSLTVQPQPPSITGAGTSAGVPLTAVVFWSFSPSSDVTGYNVYRSISAGPFSKISSVSASTGAFTDTTVAGGTTYNYAVTAIGNDNVESVFSNVAAVAVIMPPPTNLAATVPGNAVALTWVPPAVSDLSGFNVYRSTVAGTGFTKLSVLPGLTTEFVDNTVQSGTTYYYVVTSFSPSNVESVFSNQVAAVIP